MSSEPKLQASDNAEIPKTIHFIWAGPNVGRFIDEVVAHDRAINPECECILWLDAFTMCPKAVNNIGEANIELFIRYNTWRQLAASQCNDKINEKPRHQQPDFSDPKNLKTITDMVSEMRILFSKTYLQSEAKKKELIALSPALEYMSRFAEQNKITIRFLDQEYMNWYKKGGITTFLCQWTWIELYRKSPNYGSWGDLVRVQLLLDYGGMYCDHDDIMSLMHDRNVYPDGYRGYKAARAQGPTTSFQAAPKNHALLRTYQSQIANEYEQLLKDGYRWNKSPVSEKQLYWEWMAPPATREDREKSVFYWFTQLATGPSRLNSVVVLYDALFADSNWWRETRVKSGDGHAWLKEAEEGKPRTRLVLDPPGNPLPPPKI